MIFLAWVIIIIVLFLYSYTKSVKQKSSYQKQKTSHREKKTIPNRTPAPFSPTYRKGTEKPKEDVLARARRNVAEDFDTPPSTLSSVSKTKERLLNKYQEQLASKSKEEGSVTDIRLEPEPIPFETYTDASASADLMETVQDLIVKGYEPKLSFERDFIAEGMDLLNKYY